MANQHLDRYESLGKNIKDAVLNEQLHTIASETEAEASHSYGDPELGEGVFYMKDKDLYQCGKSRLVCECRECKENVRSIPGYKCKKRRNLGKILLNPQQEFYFLFALPYNTFISVIEMINELNLYEVVDFGTLCFNPTSYIFLILFLTLVILLMIYNKSGIFNEKIGA